MKLSPPLITAALGIAGAIGVWAWWSSPGAVIVNASPSKPLPLPRQEIKPPPISHNGTHTAPNQDDSFEPGMPTGPGVTLVHPLHATSDAAIPQQPPLSLPVQPADAPGTASAPQAPRTLAARASLVQQQANRELERLVPLLNLSEEQQDRVFARLAQNSVFWTPALTTDVATNPTSGTVSSNTSTSVPEQTKSIPDLLISTPEGETPILDPEQEVAIAQDQLDRQAWWEEVLGNLQQDLKNGTTSTTAAAAAAPPPDATSDPNRDLATDPIIMTEQGADTVVD